MRKVAIIGTAPASRDMAPWDDQSWEIWACSPGNHGDNNLKRVTVWFELHGITGLTGPEVQGWIGPYLKWLREASFPIYMQERNDLVPQAKVFPMPVLVGEFGKNWFTSSIAWMMALAIHERVDEIAIFGVDMAADSELYGGQRDGCIRFCEIAEERGIKVTIPWESCLGHHRPLYGYDQATPFGRRMAVLKAMADNQRAKLQQDREKLTLELAFADGAIAQMRYVMATWIDGSEATQFMDLPDQLIEEAKKYAEARLPTPAKAEGGNVRGLRDMREWPPTSQSNEAPVVEDDVPASAMGADKLGPPPLHADDVGNLYAAVKPKPNGSGRRRHARA